MWKNNISPRHCEAVQPRHCEEQRSYCGEGDEAISCYSGDCFGPHPQRPYRPRNDGDGRPRNDGAWMAPLNPLAIILIALLCCLQTTAQKRATVFIADMTSQELTARIRAGAKRVLVFSGGTEASGPHLVLGKHNYRVQQYAAQIADSLGNTLVAPVLPFAPNSPVLQRLPGTITLSDPTFTAVNEEVARSLADAGFRYIILMSDHYNSQLPLRSLAARLDSVMKGKGVRVFFSGDGYAKARTQIEAMLAARNEVPGGHGGLWDAAETWAVTPTAVRTAYFAAGDTTKGGNGPLSAAGVSGDPCKATPELGRLFGQLRVRLAVAEIRSFIK